MSAQPLRSGPVQSVPQLVGTGVIGMTQQPFLLVADQAALVVVPFLLGGLLQVEQSPAGRGSGVDDVGSQQLSCSPAPPHIVASLSGGGVRSQ